MDEAIATSHAEASPSDGAASKPSLADLEKQQPPPPVLLSIGTFGYNFVVVGLITLLVAVPLDQALAAVDVPAILRVVLIYLVLAIPLWAWVIAVWFVSSGKQVLPVNRTGDSHAVKGCPGADGHSVVVLRDCLRFDLAVRRLLVADHGGFNFLLSVQPSLPGGQFGDEAGPAHESHRSAGAVPAIDPAGRASPGVAARDLRSRAEFEPGGGLASGFRPRPEPALGQILARRTD